MREVVRDIVTGESGLSPERKGADPGWFVVAEDKLRGTINWRNKAMEKFWRGGSAERRRSGNHSGPKRLLRQARKSLKNAVRAAKEEWIMAVVAEANGKTSGGAAMDGAQA
jgi:hypothetical protein